MFVQELKQIKVQNVMLFKLSYLHIGESKPLYGERHICHLKSLVSANIVCIS